MPVAYRSQSWLVVEGDAVWRAITRHANEACDSGQDALARALYEAALREAERIFEVACSDPDSEAVQLAPTLCNVSCCNLAELALKREDPTTAESFLRRAFELLLDTASDSRFSLELRAGAMRQLRLVTSALARHLEEQGYESAAEHTWKRAHGAALDLQQVVKPLAADDTEPSESGWRVRGGPRR